VTMPDQEKEKTAAVATPAEAPSAPPLKTPAVPEEASSQYFFGEPLVGFDPSEITGSLVVIEAWTARDARHKLLCCKSGWSRKDSRCRRADCGVRIW